MKKRDFFIGALFLIVMLMMTSVNQGFAQRFVDINCGYGTIREVITADSLNRVANPNTVYRLHRGTADSVYYLDAAVGDWGSMPLNIISTGTGDFPTIIAATLSDGTPFSPIFSIKANLSMNGVTITARNTLGTLALRIFHIRTDSVTLRLEYCRIIEANQSSIRAESQHDRIFLKNCRISNVAQDWSNARVVDNRTVTIDTLSMINCTFYRIGSRIYREGSGILTYGYFDHNTVVDVAGPTFQLGNTLNLVFTNNLLVNCGFLGHGMSSTGAVVDVNSIPSGQSAYISNNVLYADTASLSAAYHAYSDTVTFVRWFSDTLLTFMANAGTTNLNIGDQVTFQKAPWELPDAVPIDSIVRLYWMPASPIVDDASILRVGSIHLVNLAYNPSATAYTFGSDGRQVGSLEWFAVQQTQSVPGGWNLISVPVTPDYYTKTFLFPTAVSEAFAYSGGYVVAQTLENGAAYWLRFSGPQTVTLLGLPRTQDSIAVVQGWNLVGSISSPVQTTSIATEPGGMIASQFFAYDGGYTRTDTIQPGKGYWVKVNQPGKLYLSSSGTFQGKNRITIVPSQELPPPPPDGQISDLNSGIPKQFALEQNYPNPFNPSTVITYSLPAGGRVTLMVYNTLGQEIATLVNADQKAGSYTVRWDGVNDRGTKLSSGLYFYRLRAGAFVSTKKMMLVQ